MISTDTKTPHRFTPPWHKPAEGEAAPDAPVYLIRAGNVIERGLLEAELAGEYRAGPVYDFELLAAFAEGVTALLDDAGEAEQLVSLAEADALKQEIAGEERSALADARNLLAEHWPNYRALTARLARRNQLAGVLAFRRFCVGWENVEAEFARGVDGLVTMDAIGALDPLDLKVAGLFAFDLLYAGGQEKNSSRPSKSDAAPRTSPSAAPSREGGKSPAKGGRKTRS